MYACTYACVYEYAFACATLESPTIVKRSIDSVSISDNPTVQESSKYTKHTSVIDRIISRAARTHCLRTNVKVTMSLRLLVQLYYTHHTHTHTHTYERVRRQHQINNRIYSQ